MANTYSTDFTTFNGGGLARRQYFNANGVWRTAKITLASQGSGDTITLWKEYAGEVPLFGILLASATLGASATIAIGTAASAAKYRAAATHTVTVPTFFGVAAACGTPLTADADVLITIAVAALPSSGTVQISMCYAN
jgi:hypothetical protein